MKLENFKKGDMIGMRFSYFNHEYHRNEKREVHGIIVGFTPKLGWKVLITYDSENKRKSGFIASYSDTWIKSRLKGENIWRISGVNEN